MEQEYPYLRIRTAYYKIVKKPLASGDRMTLLLPWSVECIKQDHGKSYLSGIPKYDGFCFVPSHLHYQRFIGNFYNRYHPFIHVPKFGQPERTLAYLGHIFGDQLEYGLDYLKILLEMPMQMLPILCLVSTERNTGKTTFLNLLKAVFGINMTINTNEDFRSNFNADWAHNVIIEVDETFLERREDSQRLKNLSTATFYKSEAKSQDRQEIEFFGKFILCSNNGDNFVLVDPGETWYWIPKLPVFEKENVRPQEQMTMEIPAFLFHLLERPLSVPVGNTRMWFSEQQIRTDALLRVMLNNRNRLETELLLLFKEIQEHDPAQKMCFSNKDIIDLLKKSIPRLTRQDVLQQMQKECGLVLVPNSLSYSTYCYNNLNELVTLAKTGRCYTITEEWLRQKFDESG